MKWRDYRAWQRVEDEIAKTARQLCSQHCDDDCRACGAGNDKEWRRDALEKMRRESETAKAEDGG